MLVHFLTGTYSTKPEEQPDLSTRKIDKEHNRVGVGIYFRRIFCYAVLLTPAILVKTVQVKQLNPYGHIYAPNILMSYVIG